MKTPATISPSNRFEPRRKFPFYYGWVIVVVAALAMSATLPGRTHGLGLVEDPLTADLQMSDPTFARIVLVTSLLGAAFCIPIGWLLDRCGVRIVMLGVTVGLALAVIRMAHVTDATALFAALLFTRGLGQSSLSVVSMAAVGKWFRGRLGAAMGAYSVLLTFGFAGGVVGLEAAVQQFGWRAAWGGLGWTLLLFVAPLQWLLHRNTPEECGEVLDPLRLDPTEVPKPETDHTLIQALRTPAFWVFAGGTALFNLMWSALTLFNVKILREAGFTRQDSAIVLAILGGAGLVTNLAGGALARRERLGPLMGIGLLSLCAALGMAPSIATRGGLFVYAAGMGLAGGLIVVIFFAAWRHLFGRSHLGRIQGAAQLLSVLASAIGPVVIADSRAYFGDYGPFFYGMSICTGVVGLAAFAVPLPSQVKTVEASNLVAAQDA